MHSADEAGKEHQRAWSYIERGTSGQQFIMSAEPHTSLAGTCQRAHMAAFTCVSYFPPTGVAT